MTVAVPTGYAAPIAATLPAPTPTTGTDSKGLRMIGGQVTMDNSGRMWVRGLAQETVDDNEDFDDLLGRMGWGD
jgi:hypothetical protein